MGERKEGGRNVQSTTLASKACFHPNLPNPIAHGVNVQEQGVEELQANKAQKVTEYLSDLTCRSSFIIDMPVISPTDLLTVSSDLTSDFSLLICDSTSLFFFLVEAFFEDLGGSWEADSLIRELSPALLPFFLTLILGLSVFRVCSFICWLYSS